MTIPKANKIKIIIAAVIVVIIAALMIVFKEQLFSIRNNMTDSEKFYKEYNQVPVDNVFKYVTLEQAKLLFEADEAIIFFGFKDCKWCQSYAPILDQYAKANDVNTIYYCDIKESRANNTEEYVALVTLLDEYLEQDQNGNKRIYVPDVYFVKEGKIVGHNNDTSTEQGADIEEYYSVNGENLKEKINSLFTKLNNTCDDSGKGC